MKNIIIHNNIVESIQDPLETIGIDPMDTERIVVQSDNPDIEIGWLYINGEFIKS